MSQVIYLDCAATTPIDPRVQAEMVRYVSVEYGNASSRTHDFGQRARRAVEGARGQVAAVAGCGRGEVLFTSGATESNNLAILGLADFAQKTGRRHIVTTQIEHNAVLEPIRHLESRGFDVTVIPPNAGGWVEPADIASALRADTLLVSVMHINNETGIIQPIEQIADQLADHAAYFHVDAAQSFGRLIEPLRHRRIDLISMSGHKLHAPKGIGALIARRRGPAPGMRPPIAPLMFGGGQELGLRPGTLPVHLIVALGLAAELAQAEHAERESQCRQFRDRLLDALRPLEPTLHGDQSRVAPHIVNLAFPGLDAETVIDVLRDIVAISNGSACTSASETCSHVLSAMRLPAAQIQGAVRLSWSHLTPEPDFGRIVDAIRSVR